MLFALCAPAEAQQPAGKVPRIGFLDSGSASDPRNILGVEALRQGLRDLGYVEGKNINIDYRYDEGKPGRLQELAEELVRLRVDILMGMDTSAAQAAKKATTSIPVIFTTGGSPIASGLVASLARPGGNVTGVTTNSPELVEKRLALLKEAVPKLSRIAFLMPAESVTIRAMFDNAQGAAKVLGVQFRLVEVRAQNPDFEGAFRTMSKDRIGVLSRKDRRSSVFTEKRFYNLRHSTAFRRYIRSNNGRTPVGSCLTGRVELSPIVVSQSTWTKFSKAQSPPICPSSSQRSLSS